MTDPEIIKAVLESCGWTEGEHFTGTFRWLKRGASVHREAPDILYSLDACHEVFEKDVPLKDAGTNRSYYAELVEMAELTFPELCRRGAAGLAKAINDLPPRQRCLAWLKFKGIKV